MADRPPIDANRFDELLAAAKPELLWGCEAIAAAAGVSEGTVRKSWAKNPAIPIRRRGGRYFALRSELTSWLRGQTAGICRSLPGSPSMQDGS